MPTGQKMVTANESLRLRGLMPQAQSLMKLRQEIREKMDELIGPLLQRLHDKNVAPTLPQNQCSPTLEWALVYDALMAFRAKQNGLISNYNQSGDSDAAKKQKMAYDDLDAYFSALHELTSLRDCIKKHRACVGLLKLKNMVTKHSASDGILHVITQGPDFRDIQNKLQAVTAGGDEGGEEGKSNVTDSKTKQQSEPQTKIKSDRKTKQESEPQTKIKSDSKTKQQSEPQTNIKPKTASPNKRPRSPQPGVNLTPQMPQHPPIPDPAVSETSEEGLYNDDMTKQQSIGMIARKEALHHVEMAWRAQQRLVRRCLGLRLFGETHTGENEGEGKTSSGVK